MRRFGVILFLFIFFESCGTTGNVQLYNFNASKNEVERKLRNIINEDSVHSVPVKWADIYKNPGPIEYIYLYFSKSPEEMYQVGFANSEEWKTAANCQLGLIGLFNGDHWEYRKGLSYIEMKRIRERFEKEILSKLKYTYSKSR